MPSTNHKIVVHDFILIDSFWRSLTKGPDQRRIFKSAIYCHVLTFQKCKRYQTGKICMAWAAMRGATANESRHSLIMHLIVWRGCSDVVIIRIQRHSDSQKPFSIVALSLLNHNTSRQLICCHCQNIYLHPSHPYSLLFLPCSFTANQCTKQHGPLVSCFKLLCVFNKT